MKHSDKIFVAGHNGLVGSGLLRCLKSDGFENILTATSAELDLRDQHAVQQFFEKEKPVYVFLAAAKVGGIMANNTYRGDFIYDNLMIQNNVIHESYRNGVKKLLFLGSSCIYPKLAPQPISEESLMTGFLEPTNSPYAMAKIAGIEMCDAYRDQYGCNFISVMPTNLYGPRDNYDLQNAHVLPALIRKFHEAKVNGDERVTVWGTGTPRREFLHVNDAAAACCFLMQHYNERGIVNIGYGEDHSIGEMAELIKYIIGFEGELVFDTSKPDGTMKKLLDSSKLYGMGWKPGVDLPTGLENTYKDFKENYDRYIASKDRDFKHLHV